MEGDAELESATSGLKPEMMSSFTNPPLGTHRGLEPLPQGLKGPQTALSECVKVEPPDRIELSRRRGTGPFGPMTLVAISSGRRALYQT